VSNGGVLGRRNVPGVDGLSGVWSVQEIANMRRKGISWDALDLFDSDTTAQYTQFADAAGTWAIANGELVATGGSQAVFIRNGASYTDVAVEVDLNWAVDGGIAFRFIDNSNYYLAVLSDDSSSSGIDIQMFKRVAGSFTQLGGNIDLQWPRGMTRRFRITAVSTTLKVYVDDWEFLSVSDSTHAGPGGIGVRNNGGGMNASKYQALRYGRL
jgi:hypothetical protein